MRVKAQKVLKINFAPLKIFDRESKQQWNTYNDGRKFIGATLYVLLPTCGIKEHELALLQS